MRRIAVTVLGRQVAKLVSLEQRCDSSKRSELGRLSGLVAANERHKRQEAAFKANCETAAC